MGYRWPPVTDIQSSRRISGNTSPDAVVKTPWSRRSGFVCRYPPTRPSRADVLPKDPLCLPRPTRNRPGSGYAPAKPSRPTQFAPRLLPESWTPEFGHSGENSPRDRRSRPHGRPPSRAQSGDGARSALGDRQLMSFKQIQRKRRLAIDTKNISGSRREHRRPGPRSAKPGPVRSRRFWPP